jgi:hypothetical protein
MDDLVIYPGTVFQTRVDEAVVQLEWTIARQRRVRIKTSEIDSLKELKAKWGDHATLQDILASDDVEPLAAKVLRLQHELHTEDVTADEVSPSLIRQVPLDLLAWAIAKEIVGQGGSPLRLSLVPDHVIFNALIMVAQRNHKLPRTYTREAFDHSDMFHGSSFIPQEGVARIRDGG